MSFEKPDQELNNADSRESDLEQESTIENTATFKEAVESGDLDQAEAWLTENLEYSDKRWLDHRSRELFKAYRQIGDWAGAKRMIDLASDEDGKEGRKKVLEKEAGIPYDEI